MMLQTKLNVSENFQKIIDQRYFFKALVASTAKFVEDNTGPVANVTTALLAVMAKVGISHLPSF